MLDQEERHLRISCLRASVSACIYNFLNIGAEAGTRTPTPEGTAPSRQRVYQFHHFRTGTGQSVLGALTHQLTQKVPDLRTANG